MRLLIEGRVDEVEILLVHLLLGQAQALAEALEMHDLPGPQELDDIIDVRVVGQAQDVVIGDPGLLLGGQVLCQVGDQVALDGHGRRVPRGAGGGGGIHTGGVIHEIRLVSRLLDLLRRHVPGQLVDDGADDLQVSQLLGAQRSIGNVSMYQIRGQARGLWI